MLNVSISYYNTRTDCEIIECRPITTPLQKILTCVLKWPISLYQKVGFFLLNKIGDLFEQPPRCEVEMAVYWCNFM